MQKMRRILVCCILFFQLYFGLLFFNSGLNNFDEKTASFNYHYHWCQLGGQVNKRSAREHYYEWINTILMIRIYFNSNFYGFQLNAFTCIHVSMTEFACFAIMRVSSHYFCEPPFTSFVEGGNVPLK